MKRMMKYLLFIGIAGIVFLSCKKEKQPNTYLGYDYFPNNVGHYVIYECDSIIFNPYDTVHHPQFDTFKYQIKEVIESLYLNDQGQLTQRIVRYKRNDNSSLPWSSIFTPEKVWSGTMLSNMAIRDEDNYPYIKLVFPMNLNEQWNGNALNTIGTWNYQYTTLNTPATVNGVYFDSTLTVMQINQPSLEGNQFYEEQYAAGVGLIYKEVIDWNTHDTLYFTKPPPLNKAAGGTILYTETYLSSGNQ